MDTPSGWWWTYPSEKYESVGMMNFPIWWESHKMFQTTNQILVTTANSIVSSANILNMTMNSQRVVKPSHVSWLKKNIEPLVLSRLLTIYQPFSNHMKQYLLKMTIISAIIDHSLNTLCEHRKANSKTGELNPPLWFSWGNTLYPSGTRLIGCHKGMKTMTEATSGIAKFGV